MKKIQDSKIKIQKTAEQKTSVSRNLRELNVQYEKDRALLARAYMDVFQANPSGQKVLADLAMRFYDRPGLAEGEPEHMSLVHTGERNVVLHIIKQCAAAQEG